eukprot:PhF_6_TR23793/c0_g1_i2/m.33294
MRPTAAHAITEFSTHRRPWNEYLTLLTKQDSQPFHSEPLENPKYRGYKRGMEGWAMAETVQLHYHRYPDEKLFTNLHRWRSGDLVGNVAVQQFRNTQPFPLVDDDTHSFNSLAPEEYMKLNYKNPKVFCKYLTRAGTYYQRGTLKLSPEAHRKLQQAVVQAKTLGLFPKYGNPFWYRLQANKPPAYLATYDPTQQSASTKNTMEQFCFTWLQTERIKKYFSEKEQQREKVHSRSPSEVMMDLGYPEVNPNDLSKAPVGALQSGGVEVSGKDTKVPGLMSTVGLRRNPFLYSTDRKMRIGFTCNFQIKDILKKDKQIK